MKTCHWMVLLSSLAFASAPGAERQENFDREPVWDGHQNRSAKPETVRQDFGWSAQTRQAGGAPGEIGGLIGPAAEPAYYARKFAARTFDDELTASGTLLVEKGSGHMLLGFFNAGTLNEWRTPNTIALRINPRGDIFHCHLEYCTRQWRAGAGIFGEYDKVRDRMSARELSCGRVCAWSLRYDPKGQDGRGRLTATLDGETAACELTPGHKADGAGFDHFGLLNVMKQYDGGGRLWLDNVTIHGIREEFTVDPGRSTATARRTRAAGWATTRRGFGRMAPRTIGRWPTTPRARTERGGLR